MTQANLILNVDDNDAGRHAKTRLLRNAGFDVEEASNGAEALTMVAQLSPELVLLDVKLPDILGSEVCRRIKADPATSSTFIVQISAAFVSRQDKVIGMASGADDYIAAPFETTELISKVRALLAQKER